MTDRTTEDEQIGKLIAEHVGTVDGAAAYRRLHKLVRAAFQWQAEQQKGEVRRPDDEMVRYCPECGLIGPIKPPARTCCPDSFGMSVRRWQAKKMERILDRLRAASHHVAPLSDARISEIWDQHAVPVFGKTGINPVVFARALLNAASIHQTQRCAGSPGECAFNGACMHHCGRAAPPAALPQVTVDELADKIAEALQGTWHCGRVWEAWSVGTMSEDDFSPVSESDTPREIAEMILKMIALPRAPASQPEPARRRAPWPDFFGNAIHEGDTIVHPAGDSRATVVFSPEHEERCINYGWRAVYQDGESLWLGNQVGSKGRAIVQLPPIKVERLPADDTEGGAI